MSVSTRTVLVPSLAASLILMTPHAVPAQAVSSRPASVALTVVVPPRGLGNLTSVDAAVLHVLDVREVRLSAGAGFVVAICGDLMTMPGLPRQPAAELMSVDADGNIHGLS